MAAVNALLFSSWVPCLRHKHRERVHGNWKYAIFIPENLLWQDRFRDSRSLEIVFVILVHKHLTGCNECWVVVHSDAILTCDATPMTLLATSVQPMQLAGLGWRYKCASRSVCETSMQPQGFPAATAEKDQMFCRKSTITLFQLTNDYFKQQNWSLINFSESSIHPVWIYMIVAQCWHLHK